MLPSFYLPSRSIFCRRSDLSFANKPITATFPRLEKNYLRFSYANTVASPRRPGVAVHQSDSYPTPFLQPQASMTRPATPPILSELRNASSPASQIRALRDLKNEIIGHDEKKEQWVGLGVVTPLARILNSHRKNGKKKSREVNGAGHLTRSRTMRTEEEDARLQAVIIVGSLAFGQSSSFYD